MSFLGSIYTAATGKDWTTSQQVTTRYNISIEGSLAKAQKLFDAGDTEEAVKYMEGASNFYGFNKLIDIYRIGYGISHEAAVREFLDPDSGNDKRKASTCRQWLRDNDYDENGNRPLDY